jgi:hypothetical protein
MSDLQEFASDAEIDAAVRSTYRANASEKVPVHLDRMVLADARREAGRKNRATFLPGWLVPVAFAAVLALSLSFNLEFNRPDVVPTVQDHAGAEGNNNAAFPVVATDDLETAVESTGKRLRALDDAVSNLAPGNKPASAPEAAAIGETGQGISPAANTAIADRSCGVDVTASAETWWSCIEVLQLSGQTNAARSELELLEAAFPEYKLAR